MSIRFDIGWLLATGLLSVRVAAATMLAPVFGPAQIPGTAVYDFVPPGTAYPYITIGDNTAISSDTKSKDGQEFTITIHTWHKAEGRKATQDLLQSIHTALHNQESTLTLSGFTLVLLRFDFMDAFQDTSVQGNNDHYYHGVIRFRGIVRTN